MYSELASPGRGSGILRGGGGGKYSSGLNGAWLHGARMRKSHAWLSWNGKPSLAMLARETLAERLRRRPPECQSQGLGSNPSGVKWKVLHDFMVSWFHGFTVSWFHGFMVSWFHGGGGWLGLDSHEIMKS